MDWANIVSVIAALAVAVGLPLALRKRKKEGSQKREQFFNHLQGIGVKASLGEAGAGEEKVGVSRSWGQRSEGVIKIESRNIAYVNVISVASQYGVRYFLDYLAGSPGWSGKKRKKTSLVKKRDSGIWGRVVDIEWKGDDYLSRELNWDYQLKDKLLQTELGELKDSILIVPEAKHGYARVRTSYILPSLDLFGTIDIIAKHVKSGW